MVDLSAPPMTAQNVVRSPSTPNSRRRQGGSDEAAFLNGVHNKGSDCPPKPNPRTSTGTNQRKNQGAHHQKQIGPSRVSDEAAAPTRDVPVPSGQSSVVGKDRKVPKGAIGISGELESMIADHQKSRGRANLVRASSSNVMLIGNLGNLRQQGTGNNNIPRGEHSPNVNGSKYANYNGIGNIVKKPALNNHEPSSKPNGGAKLAASMCRALSTRMDPEQLKIMGNEDYKNGRFAEALALYDAAISIDPDKASYRSNKSAALTALGRLLEAVFECREAIQIEPRYHRAHNRLGTLYLRLGEAEKAIYHYKQAGPEADPEDISKARTLQTHLSKCTEARKLRDLHTVIKASELAITAGADSAPQMYALQAEALLKLHRHQDADEALGKSPKFDVAECTKFFGPIGNANLLVVRAQVDMAMGRFEEALEAAQRAVRLDPNNKEASTVAKWARAVAVARSRGNELFKALRFSEACVAYGEGLEHDPYNSVLLCNRAACRVKLSQYEKAVEDCTVALNLRPAYSKARLRRGDCYAKLEKWEASIRDYEMLMSETPEDEEIQQALSKVQAQLHQQQQQSNWTP
ncbi:hypothetical protein CDL15_Pgr001781 [Punica granatum]|nr:hypothetical protein CDL15_Pgr001781 [Punica granatum]